VNGIPLSSHALMIALQLVACVVTVSPISPGTRV
jgi:hypothetical protein